MASMDLLSYERDSRWMPHLSWTHLDWTLQQGMEKQAAQREQAWQRIADKLGPLLAPSETGGGGGCSFGQSSDYIGRDIEDQEFFEERAYEKAPLLSSHTRRSSRNQSSQSLNRPFVNRYVNVEPFKAKSPSHQTTTQSEKNYQATATNNSKAHQTDSYDCESLKKAKRRCWTVSTVLVSLILLLFVIVTLMAFGILKYGKAAKAPL